MLKQRVKLLKMLAFSPLQLRAREAHLCVYHHGELVVDLWCGRDKINGKKPLE
jgi:hypothetical protein